MNMLNEIEAEIYRNVENLKTLNPSTDEYKKTLEATSVLIDKRNDILSHMADADEKEKQRKVDTTDRWVRNGITLALGLGKIALIVWGVKSSMLFERTDTITTMAGRNMNNALFGFLKEH